MRRQQQTTKKHIVTPEKQLGIVKTTTPSGYKLLRYKPSGVAGYYYNLVTVFVTRSWRTTYCVLFDVTRSHECERKTKQSDGVNQK